MFRKTVKKKFTAWKVTFEFGKGLAIKLQNKHFLKSKNKTLFKLENCIPLSQLTF